MIRWRSALRSIASSSLTAEAAMRTLYLSTLAERTDQGFEAHPGFPGALPERRQIFRIFRQRLAYRLVDDLGHRLRARSRLHAQGAMQVGVEVDSGALGGIFHGVSSIASRR